METADGVGYFWAQTGAGTFNTSWSGTTAIDLDGSASEGTIHSVMNISDIAANDSCLTVDGADADSQADAATLNAVDPVNITLGARTDALADQYAGVYGPQFYLDLTGTTVNAALKNGLMAAINTAAIQSGYDANVIAATIYNYDNKIRGYYWPLNEIVSGGASGYYLLARSINGLQEQTADFYGLVSPSGVSGTTISGEAGAGSIYSPKHSIYNE